jgi:hypothetical protein
MPTRGQLRIKAAQSGGFLVFKVQSAKFKVQSSECRNSPSLCEGVATNAGGVVVLSSWVIMSRQWRVVFYYLDPGSAAGVTPPTNNQQPFFHFFLDF